MIKSKSFKMCGMREGGRVYEQGTMLMSIIKQNMYDRCPLVKRVYLTQLGKIISRRGN